MVAYNVSRIARGAQSTMEDYGSEAEAIRSGLNPMLRDIEVQSGMVSGANVLPNRLFTNAPQATALAAYYDALANKLPGYVNARRAYAAADKKKQTAGSSATPPYTSSYTTPPTLPPVTAYLPNVGYVPDFNRNVVYGVSPYGAMPMGTIPKTRTQPASRVLAQRRVSSMRGKAGIE